MTASPQPHLVSFSLDPVALMSLSVARKTIPPSGDLGYVIHQTLVETFGEAAPKPFHLLEKGFKVLAYSRHPAHDLVDIGLEHGRKGGGWELSSRALGFPTLDGAAIPNPWLPAKRCQFSVRARPVVRLSHAKERGLPRECDVFLHAVSNKPKESEAWLDRQTVYLSWFGDQVAKSGAKLGQVQIARMTRTQVYRKGAASLDGPDVTFTGSLEVNDSALFNEFVLRGVGRHRAFGFGMLLLRSGGP